MFISSYDYINLVPQFELSRVVVCTQWLKRNNDKNCEGFLDEHITNVVGLFVYNATQDDDEVSW